jgi:P pilus assembly chaperone PapD
MHARSLASFRALLALLIAPLTVATFPVVAGAQGPGDLLIAPTRIVLEGRIRTAEIALVNIGTAPATYRISLVRQRMTEDGRFEEVTEPLEGEQFADGLVRFTPRQAVLEPRVTQTIRLQLRKPADLLAGEYRSHLLFRAVPQVTAAAPEDQPPAEGLGIQLIPVYGISIPVIVRHGETWAKVTLSDLALQPPADDSPLPAMHLTLNRTGNRSTYGDLTVSARTPGAPKETVLARAAGLAVYVPNPARKLTLTLQVPEGLSLSGSKLRVVYRNKPEDGGATLAEAFLDVP